MDRHFVIVAGPDQGKSFPIADGQTLSLGRGQASDTKINDPRMSRVHCRVQVDGGKTMLFDAGGSGGTLVDGEKVLEVELQPGAVFQLGDTQVRYQLSTPQEDVTMKGGADQAFGRPKPKPKIAPLTDLVGKDLAQYHLDSIIAHGDTGIVFKGRDTEKDRVAAIKVLTPDPTSSDEQKERFVRAMKTMLPIRHPHIVRLYNAGKTGPYCWAAMEYIDGESLTSVIERIGIEGMLDWREVFRVAVHIGRALQEGFERKVIHRNLTPANILRRHEDKVCLLGDMMLAKALEGSLSKQVTAPGQLVGEVAYMSPERTRDQTSVDHRSDLYGLGATLYALLTGHAPFENDSLPELVRMVCDAEPVKPKEYQLSINEKFQDVVLQLIAKQPEARFQQPAEMLVELERIGKFNSLKMD